MFGKLFGKKHASKKLTEPKFANGDLEGFWRWFAENAPALSQFVRHATQEPVPEEMMNAVGEALVRVHPDLVFELGIAADDKLDLVISGGGLTSAFPAVLALHKAAPASDVFKATAFRQRMPGMSVRMAGRELSAETSAYVSEPGDEGKLDIWVFLPLPDDASEQDAGQIGYILLDTTLGEYDVATSLGGISFYSMAQAPEGAKPLSELVAEVDALNAGRSLQ